MVTSPCPALPYPTLRFALNARQGADDAHGRQINNDLKLERREMEDAAVKIQRRAKGMKDRKRVKAIKEDREKQQELDEQAKAAVKIQALQRKKKDMKKVEQLKSNNQVLASFFSLVTPCDESCACFTSLCQHVPKREIPKTRTCAWNLGLGVTEGALLADGAACHLAQALK